VQCKLLWEEILPVTLVHVRFETVGISSHFASSSIRQDKRFADRIPLSVIARTVSGGQISHKITGNKDSGPSEVIFLTYAPYARDVPSKPPARVREKPPFVEGSNVILGNLSFSVYAVSYFIRLVDTTPPSLAGE